MTTERNLTISQFIQGVPVNGFCTKCGLVFRTDPDLMAKPEEAMQFLRQQFYNHACYEKAPKSQTA